MRLKSPDTKDFEIQRTFWETKLEDHVGGIYIIERGTRFQSMKALHDYGRYIKESVEFPIVSGNRQSSIKGSSHDNS